MATPTITEHQTRSDRHTTHYLACGPADGTPVKVQDQALLLLSAVASF